MSDITTTFIKNKKILILIIEKLLVTLITELNYSKFIKKDTIDEISVLELGLDFWPQ